MPCVPRRKSIRPGQPINLICACCNSRWRSCPKEEDQEKVDGTIRNRHPPRYATNPFTMTVSWWRPFVFLLLIDNRSRECCITRDSRSSFVPTPARNIRWPSTFRPARWLTATKSRKSFCTTAPTILTDLSIASKATPFRPRYNQHNNLFSLFFNNKRNFGKDETINFFSPTKFEWWWDKWINDFACHEMWNQLTKWNTTPRTVCRICRPGGPESQYFNTSV